MTVRGENLPSFAQVGPVEFAGRDFSPVPSVSTSRAGSFEIEIEVPTGGLGDQPLRVEVSGVVITHIVEVGTPPLSGPADRVFRDLMRAGVLLRVWNFERATQELSLFDPNSRLVEFNSLVDVKRRTIYWMDLASPHGFQGDLLVKGWNPVFAK